MFQNCVLLSFTVKLIGNTAKGDIDEIETDADRKMLRLSKSLLDCEEYRNLHRIASTIRKEIRQVCIGTSSEKFQGKDGKTYQIGGGLNDMIKQGCYITPLRSVPKVQDIIKEFQPIFDDALTKLIEVYENEIRKSKARLGSQFKRSDYFPVERLRDLCFITYKYLDVGIPDSLRGISQELFESEQKKASEVWANATKSMDDLLTVAFSKIVDSMLEKLNPETGKKKRLTESGLQQIKDFIADFPAKNISNNKELEEMVDKFRKIIGGRDLDKIKATNIREKIIERTQTIKDKLDKMMEDMPARAVCLVRQEDDEETVE